MNKNRKLISVILPLVLVISVFVVRYWAQVGVLCPGAIGNYQESFNTTTFKDPASSVDHWGEGYVSLNKLGSNFDIINTQCMPLWIDTVTANDFNNDEWPDLIVSSSGYSNVLAFAQNQGINGNIGCFEITHWIDGSAGPDADGNPTAGVGGTPIDSSGRCGLTSGDYDRDGDIDFLFMCSKDNNPAAFDRIWLYENQLEDSGMLGFTQIEKTAAWSGLLKGIGWSSTMMQTIDFDGDNDLDILMGNKEGEVLLIKNNNKNSLSHALMFTIVPILNTGWGSRGVSTVAVQDFDRDGDMDIIVGSVSQPDLKYYKNDGSDNFSLYITYQAPSFDGAAACAVTADFDKDGDSDLVVGTDNWNYNPGADIGGQCFYFRNSGGDFVQSWKFDNRPTVYDSDFAAYLDFDRDGDDDFLIAETEFDTPNPLGDQPSTFYQFVNNLADVYNLEGTALSLNVSPSLNPQQHALTKVQLTNIDQQVIGGSSLGLAVTIFVSNNDGANWEFYERFEGTDIQNYTDLHVHTFKHYGSKLRWKAILTAEDDNVPNYPNSSYETPRIDQIDFEFTYVDRREYSRTSVAATVSTEGGDNIKLIIGGTFYYPGWQGHLRAYNVNEMAPLDSSYTELRTITRPDLSEPFGREIVAEGVEVLWDAGVELDLRSADSRNIYTALPTGIGNAQTRVDFTAANEPLLASLLDDVNSDNVGLINFVRGEGRYWKLGDINHSNPVVVGPPDGDAALKGAGYESFVETWSDRPKVLYVGANDGILHCFSLLTGEELWGFIPYNLLPKLKNMWAVDVASADRYFLRDVYVDGSPAVADVQIGGDWKTILICGQGPGKGSIVGGGITGNYYFALDITDPSDPQPLWEVTHDTMGESWSLPVIGKINKDGESWAAFMGSGYDNYADDVIGNRFYAVELETGNIFWMFDTGEVDTIADRGFSWNIQNTIPGSPSLVDSDKNGAADSIYVPDLDGRVWKVDVTVPFINADSWNAEVLYVDSNNYPIISKPEVWVNPMVSGTVPRIFFGTGGDDNAPEDADYSFVALLDNEAADQADRVEWYLGDPDILNLPEEKQVGVLGFGEKVWADPKIGDFIVYFNTLTGSIESVDPCENIAGIGKLYGRFIVSKAGTVVGGSAFRTAGGNVESLTLSIKTRSAVTLGEQSSTQSGTRKRDVYIQEYDSTIQKLEQPTGGLVKVKSWREIYQIIKN